MTARLSNWTPTTIGTLGRILTGRTPSSAKPELFGSAYPFITPTDIQEGQHFVHTERFLSEEGLQSQASLLLPREAICFVCIGATIGKICVTDRPSFTNQQINSVIVDRHKHDPRFVYHLLRFEADRIKAQAGGAATPIVNKTAFSNVVVLVPALPVQQRIGGILAAYDDLIENNTRRIRILEAMAKMIYREWFVNFRFPGHVNVKMTESADGTTMPEGWRLESVGTTSLNFDSKRKPLSSIEREKRKGPYPYYGAAKVFDYIDDYIFEGRYLLFAEDGSVITNERKPVLQLTDGKFWANNHTHILQGKPPVSTSFLYLSLRDVDISGCVTGAAQPKITQANLNRIPVLVPTEHLLNDFDAISSPVLEQVTILNRQNANLRQTRDLLLPKLISGEVNVEQIETEAVAQGV